MLEHEMMCACGGKIRQIRKFSDKFSGKTFYDVRRFITFVCWWCVPLQGAYINLSIMNLFIIRESVIVGFAVSSCILIGRWVVAPKNSQMLRIL